MNSSKTGHTNMFYFCTAEVSVEAQSDRSVNLNGNQPDGQVDNCDEDQSDKEPDDVDSADCPAVETTPIDVVALGTPVDVDMCCILDADQPDDEFDIDSLTAGETSHLPLNSSAPVQRLAKSLPCLFKPGCSLDRSHWSCSYDSVFMSFFSMYMKSSPAWRNKWIWQTPNPGMWTLENRSTRSSSWLRAARTYNSCTHRSLTSSKSGFVINSLSR
jgi:hypothetical protein